MAPSMQRARMNSLPAELCFVPGTTRPRPNELISQGEYEIARAVGRGVSTRARDCRDHFHFSVTLRCSPGLFQPIAVDCPLDHVDRHAGEERERGNGILELSRLRERGDFPLAEAARLMIDQAAMDGARVVAPDAGFAAGGQLLRHPADNAIDIG